MQTCETCRWWEAPDYPNDVQFVTDDDSHFRMYDENDEPVIAPGRWGWCKRAAEIGPRRESDRFFVRDASDYHASLHTRSDFGCVEHEEAEPGA